MANRIEIIIDGDSRKLRKELDKAQTKTKGFAGKMKDQFGGLSGAAAAFGGVLAAGAFARGIGSAISRAEQMNSLYAVTDQVIRQTGGAAGVFGDELRGMNEEMQKTTGIDKALITEGSNVLLTFKNLRNEVGEGNDIFTRANDAMVDMSVVMGSDAKSAALQLGKALNDPIRGLDGLGRAGVQFSEDQRKAIKSLVETNRVADAQKIILDELESQFGGSADAAADDSAKIANAFRDLQETVGNALLPALEAAVGPLIEFAESAGHVVENITDMIMLLPQWSNKIVSEARKAAQATGQVEEFDAALQSTEDRMTDTAFLGIPVLYDGFLMLKDAVMGTSESVGYAEGQVAAFKSTVAGLESEWGREGGAPTLEIQVDDEQARKDLTDFDYYYRRLIDELNGVVLELNLKGDFGGTPVHVTPDGRIKFGGGGEIATFAEGGVVPGPMGAPVPAIVHGGETVIPAGGSMGGGVVVNVSGFVGSELALAAEIDKVLTRRSQQAGLGF